MTLGAVLTTAVAVLAPATAAEYRTRVIACGLERPTGIVSGVPGTLYVTQIPTPGIAGPDGGLNKVSEVRVAGGRTTTLTLGEPEPTNLAVSQSGELYWTCNSAGVILMRTPAGAVSVVRAGLNAPTGIALDEARGRLYFTEVPTPGMPGSQGGANRVSVIELASGALEVVDEGDPEPTDITVAKNGRVYWTCTSAGVIVEARRMK